MAIVFLILRLWAADPVEATIWIAQNDHDLADFLGRTGQRESWNTRIGIHDRDRRHARTVWRRAVEKGWLFPGFCPGHDQPAEWSTRGSFGLMAGFAWRYLPWWARCAPPWILDVPIVSAWVAKERRKHLCATKRARARRKWCRPG